MSDAKEAVTIFRAKGCDRCNNTGYKGRAGIYEMIEIDERLRVMIHEGASEHEMTAYARKHSPGILDDGRLRVLSGESTVEEVLRVTAA